MDAIYCRPTYLDGDFPYVSFPRGSQAGISIHTRFLSIFLNKYHSDTNNNIPYDPVLLSAKYIYYPTIIPLFSQNLSSTVPSYPMFVPKFLGVPPPMSHLCLSTN